MMTAKLQIVLIAIVIILSYFFIELLRQRKLDFKYCLVWFFSCLGMLVFSIWPSLIIKLSDFLGIYDPMNAMFFICIAFLTFICISLTVVVSRLSDRLRQLTQNIAIAEKERVEEK